MNALAVVDGNKAREFDMKLSEEQVCIRLRLTVDGRRSFLATLGIEVFDLELPEVRRTLTVREVDDLPGHLVEEFRQMEIRRPRRAREHRSNERACPTALRH